MQKTTKTKHGASTTTHAIPYDPKTLNFRDFTHPKIESFERNKTALFLFTPAEKDHNRAFATLGNMIFNDEINISMI